MARNRLAKFLEGVVVSVPGGVDNPANSLAVFPDDASYEVVYGAGTEGDMYFNSTIQMLRIYKNTAWENIEADELDYDNTTTGLLAQTVQDAIDEITPMTTQGDIIVGDANGRPDRLGIGAAGQVLKSSGTTAQWADESGGGGVGGEFNYIGNPDAENNETDDVTSSSGGGTWNISRTTTVAELPEPTSKTTAFKISGTTLAADDYVEFGAVGNINDADTKMGQWSVRVKDISGSIAGQYKFQCYNKTTSEYVGDSVEVSSDATYQGSVPLTPDEDIVLRLIAVGTTQSNIGLSGIKIQAQNVLIGYGGVKSYDESVVNFSSTPTGWALNSCDFTPYKDIQGKWHCKFNIDASITNTTGSSSVTIDGLSPAYEQAVSNYAQTGSGIGSAKINSSGVITRVVTTSSGGFLISGDIVLSSKPTWADFDGSVMLGTEAQAQNSFFGAEISNQSIAFGSTYENVALSNIESEVLEWDAVNSSVTIQATGKYRLTIADTVSWGTGANNMEQVWCRNTADAAGRVLLNRLNTNNDNNSSSKDMILQEGDVLYLRALVNGTSDSVIGFGAYRSYVSIARIPDKSSKATGFPFADQHPGEYGMVKVLSGDGIFESGTYNPTLYNTTNISASVLTDVNYLRIGNVVTISGSGSLTTIVSANSELRISLPFEPLANFTGIEGAGAGIYDRVATSRDPLYVIARAGTKLCGFLITVNSATTSRGFNFTFTYRIA